MKTLRMQRRLAAEVLRVGKNKVLFSPLRLKEIEEALTRTDMEELIKDNAISVKKEKETFERKRSKKNRLIKKKIKTRKRDYINRIRKLRKYIKYLKENKLVTIEEYYTLRKLSKAGQFKNLRHMKEYIRDIMKKTIQIKSEKKEKKKAK